MRALSLLVVLTLLGCGGAPPPVATTPAAPSCEDPRAALMARAIEDGIAIEASVRTSSAALAEVAAHLDAIATAAGGGDTGVPAIDYERIGALAAIEEPFRATAFSRRLYGAFQPDTVDDLFSYYLVVMQIWQATPHLAQITAGPARRAELDRSAQALAHPASVGVLLGPPPEGECPSLSSRLLGALFMDPTQGLAGTLVFVEPVLDESGQPTGSVMARAVPGGPSRTFPLLAGSQRLDRSAGHVHAIDPAASAGALGEQLGAFRGFVRSLVELRELVAQAQEIEARLLEALAQIHALADAPPEAATGS